MPCGGYVRWTAIDENRFKAEPRLRHEDMFHWMDSIQQTENIKILHGRNHSSEIRIGSYLVDGYDPDSKTVFEFNGCWFHGCSICGYDQDDIGKERKLRTEVREKFLSKQTHLVKNMRVIWEHEFINKTKKSSQDYDADLTEFVKQRQPPFYRNHKYAKISQKRLLEAV